MTSPRRKDHAVPASRIKIEVGTHDLFEADLLVCRQGGAIFRALEPGLKLEQLVPSGWAASKGGHERKLMLYRSREQKPKYRRVLAVAYRPNSNRPDAFAPNCPPHGCNITVILQQGLTNLALQRKFRSCEITSLSWRNPQMMDCVLASVLVECKQLEWMNGFRLTLVLPESRPRLVELFDSDFSLWQQYLAKLESFYSQ